jgi:hypothetical protein
MEERVKMLESLVTDLSYRVKYLEAREAQRQWKKDRKQYIDEKVAELVRGQSVSNWKVDRTRNGAAKRWDELNPRPPLVKK